jgi:hypothetical protein
MKQIIDCCDILDCILFGPEPRGSKIYPREEDLRDWYVKGNVALDEEAISELLVGIR